MKNCDTCDLPLWVIMNHPHCKKCEKKVQDEKKRVDRVIRKMRRDL